MTMTRPYFLTLSCAFHTARRARKNRIHASIYSLSVFAFVYFIIIINVLHELLSSWERAYALIPYPINSPEGVTTDVAFLNFTPTALYNPS
jgi:hypothetical protein